MFFGSKPDFADAVEHVIDQRLLRGIDQDEAVGRRDEPHRHRTGPDVVEVVEHLDRRHLLVLDVVALAAAVALAERLAGRRTGLLGNALTRTRQTSRQQGDGTECRQNSTAS